MLWCQCRWLCDPDVVVAMAREDMQGFKRYVKQGREGVGMLFPGIRIRVDQDEASELERRGSGAPAMRRSKGLKQMRKRNEWNESVSEGGKKGCIQVQNNSAIKCIQVYLRKRDKFTQCRTNCMCVCT